MGIVAVRGAEICFNAQPALVDGAGPLKVFSSIRTHGAFPGRLIHGVNARGMQIKRCAAVKREEGAKCDEAWEGKDGTEATKSKREGESKRKGEKERERKRVAYCERCKRRLKRNTKFTRVMHVLHYTSALAFLISKRRERTLRKPIN